jgi:TolA-binding protein
MNLPWRIAAYVVLAVAAVFFTQRFFASVNRDMQRVAARYATADAEPNAPEAATGGTNEAATAADASTTTNVAGVGAPAAPATPPVAHSNRTAPAASPAPAEGGSRKGLYAALALFSVVSLGLMVGREVSAYIGHRVQREIYGEASEPVGDSEYDEAERVWADGDHLEAIRLLREFLNRKPNKLHAAFRIAEIYEKDLGNHLAAALEYEEILKHRFDRQRWAWAAIHLVNLYNRLGQSEKADALLHRVAEDYGDTEAAAKARQRLGLPESGEAPAEDEVAEGQTPGTEGGFKLPPGFRRK